MEIRKKIYITLGIFLLSGHFYPVFGNSDLHEAARAFRNKNMTEAANRYKIIAEKNPGSLEVMQALYMTGKSYMENGNYGEALNILHSIRRRRTTRKHQFTYISALYQIGRCYFYLGDYIEAIYYFNKVKRADNKFLRSDAMIGIGMTHIAAGRKMEARDILTRVIKNYPGYITEKRLIIPLALVLIENREYEKAENYLEKIPEYPEAKYYRAIAIKERGKINKANKLFNEVVNEEPASFWGENSLYHIGEGFYRTQQYSFAISVFERFLNEYPDSDLRPRVLFRLGCSKFKKNRYSEAVLWFNSAIRNYPEDPISYTSNYLISESRLRQRDFAGAAEGFSRLASEEALSIYAEYKTIWVDKKLKNHNIVISRANEFLDSYSWGEISGWVHLIRAMSLEETEEYNMALREYRTVITRFEGTELMKKAIYLKARLYYKLERYPMIATEIYHILKNISPEPNKYSHNAYLIVGEALYRLGKYRPAINVYEIILSKYPGSTFIPKVYQAVSACYLKLGEHEKSRQYQQRALATAIRMDDRKVSEGSVLDIANIMFMQGKYEDVISNISSFISENPESKRVAEALFRKGEALYRLEYYSEAVRRWNRIVSEYPNSEFALTALVRAGRTFFGLQNYEAAIDSFRTLIQKNPQPEIRKEALLQIAQAYYNKGQLEKAVSKYNRYLEDYPGDEEETYVLDQMQMCFYRMDKTEDELVEFVQQFPQSRWAPDIYWRMGAEYFNDGQYGPARESFQRIIKEFPNSAHVERAYYYNAESYFLEEDYANSVVAYEKGFIKNFPRHEYAPDALFNVGIAYFNMRKHEKSIEAYNELFEKHPEHELSRNALINIAVVYNRSHQLTNAVNTYRKFIDVFPESERVPFAYLKIGEIFEEKNEYKQAIEYYEKIEPDVEEYAEAQYYVGQCYRELGMEEKEKQAYENLVDYSDSSNIYRLVSLFELAEIEARTDREKAKNYYRDIINNTTDERWISLARQRLSELN